MPALARKHLSQPVINFELDHQIDSVDTAAVLHRMWQAHIDVPHLTGGHRDVLAVQFPHYAAVGNDRNVHADASAFETPSLTAEVGEIAMLADRRARFKPHQPRAHHYRSESF